MGFDMREGLVLHNIAFEDKGQKRRILDRAAIAEMMVPYGDPSPVRSWQNYFDTGEYLVARWANSLELGCDCLGEITYLSPVVVTGRGEPREIAPGLGAPLRQHLFSARLDVAFDGGPCRVEEGDAVCVSLSSGVSPRGNSFTRKCTVLATEREAMRDADAAVGRTWVVSSAEHTNRLGHPVAYKLRPEGFFDRSPVLDVPTPTKGHCCAGEQEQSSCCES